MESVNTSCSTSNEKSLSEWPALSDACGNSGQKDPASEGPISNNYNVRNRSNRRRQKPRENSGGYDSAKENENLPQSVNGCGTKKKSSQKINWIPVPIEHQPYKKRGNGRHFNANRGGRNEGRGNFHENGRGNFRGNNSRRGRRDRDTSQYQHYQPEEASIDVQSQVMPHEHQLAVPFNNAAMFYTPYVYNVPQPTQKELTLHDMIRQQVEYYFSETNLITDKFLRERMDNQGFVDVTLVATFKRMLKLSSDVNVIIEALKDSKKLEVSDDGKVRPVVNPLSWVLSKDAVGYFDPFTGKILYYPITNDMDDLNLNGNSNPEHFNSYSINGEMGAGISGYDTINVNGDMNLDLNPVVFKPVYLNGEPCVNGISRQSPLNSNDLEVDSKMFDKMNINGDASNNSAMYGPIDINTEISNNSAMYGPMDINNDISKHNAINLKEESISSVSGPSPLNLPSGIEVDSSRYGTENVNGDISGNFTALDQIDANCNTSRHISILSDDYEAHKPSYKNINVTERNVTFVPISFKKDTSVPETFTVNDNRSTDDVSKQNSLNLNCDSDDNSQHDTRKLNGETEKVIPVITVLFDFGQDNKDCNEKTVNEVSSCNSVPELVSLKS